MKGDKLPIEEKILEELQKTGYPTEIMAAATLQRLEWDVTHNPSYLDETEGISREFDIWAKRQWDAQTEGKVFPISVDLIMACKKSADAPWVFFMTPSGPCDGRLIKTVSDTADLFWTPNTPGVPVLHCSEPMDFHHYFRDKAQRARTYHEAFKGRAKSGDRAISIYSAVMSCTKAVLFRRRIRSRHTSATIFYPVVVYSGELFEAHVESADQITLKSADHIQLSHHYTQPTERVPWWEVEHEFIVDVVRDTYLEQFLRIIEREQYTLVSHLEKAIRIGRLQLQDIH